MLEGSGGVGVWTLEPRTNLNLRLNLGAYCVRTLGHTIRESRDQCLRLSDYHGFYGLYLPLDKRLSRSNFFFFFFNNNTTFIIMYQLQ